MTLVEYFWKASQQIVMLTPNKAPNPDIEGWGSGFLLFYKGHRFLSHVITMFICKTTIARVNVRVLIMALVLFAIIQIRTIH